MVAVVAFNRRQEMPRIKQLLRLLFLMLATYGLMVSTHQVRGESPPTGFAPGSGTRTDVKPFYFAIPAPRGQILDRNGRPLAQNTVVHRLLLTVPAEQRSTLEAYTAWLEKEIAASQKDLPAARMPDAELLKRHYESRRELPVAVSDAVTQEVVIDPQ